MATLFGSPPYLSHPLTRTPHFSSSSQTPPPTPPPTPPSRPQPPTPPPQLSTTSSEQQQPTSVKVQQQWPPSPKPATTVETTDWIASSLTRRFGLGAGLAWAALLAFGVVSEQIKTRLEVSQLEANTRDVEKQEEVVLPNGIRYFFFITCAVLAYKFKSSGKKFIQRSLN